MGSEKKIAHYLMRVLSVDPGSRGCGCSFFCDGRLIKAEYVKNTAPKGNGPSECRMAAFAVFNWAREVDVLVLETQQTYGGRAAKGDANDLFPLACINGAIAGLFPVAQIYHYTPHQWKGSTSKPKPGEIYVINSRLRERLDSDELARIKWPEAVKLTHDVADAVALGLTFLCRFDRKRVYPRE